MTRTTSDLFLAFALSLLLLWNFSVHAQGTVVVQHIGSSDPLTEGFTLGTIGHQAHVGPVSGDMGLNAWVTTVSNVNNNIQYQYYLTSGQQAQFVGADWVWSFRLRIVTSSGIFGNNQAVLNTGSVGFFAYFGSETDGDPWVQFGNNPIYTLQGGGSGYHEYQLRFSAAAGAADLWVDGIERLTGLLGGTGTGGTGRLLWGEGQAGPSQANWNLISLQIIPEPTPFALFVVGLSPLLLRRLRCPYG